MKEKLDIEITEHAKKYKRLYNRVLKYIIKYDRIAVFRHIRPDYDAMGTQLGFYHWIKDNFPNKEVIYVGDNHIALTPQCFPYMMEVADEWFKKPFLALVVDTATTGRVADVRYKMAETIIKIDHHPQNKKYGKMQIVDSTMAAAGEIIANMLLTFKGDYVLSQEAARYLFMAIAGDSNRFLYNSTTTHTFAIAKTLLKTGFKLSELYGDMYTKDLRDVKATTWILQNFKVTEHGVAYYILDCNTLDMLNLPSERGKDNINLFDHFEGIHAWLSVTEDTKEGKFRISIRSAETPIDGVASRYNGGGHEQASGAKIASLKELPALLKDLDDLFK